MKSAIIISALLSFCMIYISRQTKLQNHINCTGLISLSLVLFQSKPLETATDEIKQVRIFKNTPNVCFDFQTKPKRLSRVPMLCEGKRAKKFNLYYFGKRDFHNNNQKSNIMANKTISEFYFTLPILPCVQPSVWFLLLPENQSGSNELSKAVSYYPLSPSVFSKQTKDISSSTFQNSETIFELQNVPKSKVQVRQLNRKKNKYEEQQFDPNCQEAKRSRAIAQNSNRNIIPNILHQVISFLCKKNKSSHLVAKLLHRFGEGDSYSSRRFYMYQSLLREKLNHYVSADAFAIFREIQEPTCELYSREEQLLYNKISRVLIKHYMAEEFAPAILTSRRVSSHKRHEHLITNRKMIEKMQAVLGSEL